MTTTEYVKLTGDLVKSQQFEDYTSHTYTFHNPTDRFIDVTQPWMVEIPFSLSVNGQNLDTSQVTLPDIKDMIKGITVNGIPQLSFTQDKITGEISDIKTDCPEE